MRIKSFLGLIFLGTVNSGLASDSSVHDWLDRMALAVETLDYRGTLVEIRPGKMNAFEVIRRVDEDGIKERVSALNGAPQEWLREGDLYRSTSIGASRRWFRGDFQNRLIAHQPLNQMAKLDSAYELRLGDVDRVAGFQAQRIDVWPKDGYRYAQQLWLEQQTGMWLRSVVLDRQGRRLHEQSFVTLELGASISDAELAPKTATVSFSSDAMMGDDLDSSEFASGASPDTLSGMLRPLWAPERVPEHFRLVNANHGRSDVDSAFDHLLFSDGLSSFSVYIDHAPRQRIQTQLRSVGPVHIFTGMMGQRQFTIMGQVPAQTVEFVGQQFLPSTDLPSEN